MVASLNTSLWKQMSIPTPKNLISWQKDTTTAVHIHNFFCAIYTKSHNPNAFTQSTHNANEVLQSIHNAVTIRLIYLTRASSGTECRGEYFSGKPIFLHTPKNGPARESRDTLSLDSIISARSPKKAIFLHIIAIYLHGSQKKVISMRNRIWNSSNLHNIPYFNV